LFLPNNQSGELLEKLNVFMQNGDEEGTVEYLNNYGSLLKIKDEFIVIIKNSKN
jgi:hypothetical protein